MMFGQLHGVLGGAKNYGIKALGLGFPLTTPMNDLNGSVEWSILEVSCFDQGKSINLFSYDRRSKFVVKFLLSMHL